MRTILISCLLAVFLHQSSYGAASELMINGKPSFKLTMDREYNCISIPPQNGKKMQSYIFAPADDQSGVVLYIGTDAPAQTKARIKSEAHEVAIDESAGQISRKKVSWLRYRNAVHFCGAVSVKLKDKSGIERLVSILLVANSKERRAALEEAFSTLEFF